VTSTTPTTSVVFQIVYEDAPDASYLDQEGFEERKAAWERDEFCFVGLRSVVTVHDPSSGTTLRLTSAGVWGVESDSETSYFMDLGQEELTEMADTLAQHNISIEGVTPELRDI
jgi:hypothetical protein